MYVNAHFYMYVHFMMTFKTKLDKAGPGDINRKCQGLGSRWTQWSEVPLDSQHVWAEKSRPWLSGEQGSSQRRPR